MTHQGNYEGKPILKRNEYGVLVPLTAGELEVGEVYGLDAATMQLIPKEVMEAETAVLIAELKSRGLGVSGLGTTFAHMPTTYRMKRNRKPWFLTLLAGKAPLEVADPTTLTFLRIRGADFNSAEWSCEQYDWVFLAPEDAFEPTNPSTHGTKER